MTPANRLVLFSTKGQKMPRYFGKRHWDNFILYCLGDWVHGNAAQDSKPAAPTKKEARPGKPAAGFGVYG
jgi:hypothetical protein